MGRKMQKMQVEIGTVLEGKVTGLAAFGAFVELEGGKTGLVHISEVSTEYVSDVKEHLKEGQVVKVKVIGTDKGKISLSIKQTMEAAPKPEKREKSNKDERSNKRAKRQQNQTDTRKPPEEVVFGSRNSDMSFDDMLQKFKQDSDEKFQDLKRSNDNKRSGGYKRSY